MDLRTRIVLEARSWIGTPFVHQGAVKGVGVDCLQLVIGVGKNVGVLPADFEGPTSYPRGWFLRSSRYLDDLQPYLEPVVGEPQPGDVALFRIGRAPAHSAIVTAWPRIVVADPEQGVVETHAFTDVPGPFVCALTLRGRD
jgi:cell wall-associated NlpC family hydrolase